MRCLSERFLVGERNQLLRTPKDDAAVQKHRFDSVTFAEVTMQEALRKRVLNVALNGPSQRPSAQSSIKALPGQKVFHRSFIGSFLWPPQESQPSPGFGWAVCPLLGRGYP